MTLIRAECITPPWLLEGRRAPTAHRRIVSDIRGSRRPEVTGTDGYDNTIGTTNQGLEHIQTLTSAIRYQLAKEAIRG